MAQVKLPEDFKEFFRSLNQAKIEFLVIGGYAVAYHGHPRATKDIDIWVSSEPTNIAKLAEVLREFGFDLPVLRQWAANPRKTLRMGYPPVRIEILTEIAGVEFRPAFATRVSAEMDGIAVSLISLPHLRANKRAAGRPKDLADLEELPD